jgi:hypothetical protein
VRRLYGAVLGGVDEPDEALTNSNGPPGFRPVKTIIHVCKTYHVVIGLGRLLFHRRNACPDHLVEEAAKKTHGVGDIIGPPCRKAQELTQNIADPYCVAR